MTLGFANDPLVRWMLPDAVSYLRVFPEIIDAFGGGAIAAGSAYVADEGNAVALWLPPGESPDDERMEQLMGENIAPDMLDEVVAVFEEMEAYHPHDEPCWYLPLIAADPAWLGRGLGGMLMKHALRRVDEDGLPAYLESSNPRNISLYERHGFAVMGEIQRGTSPVVTPMLRPARS
ncbi:GNAT family N-acetyltransferase [Parasphingopyxis sp.]|uniref:GNAT family N-acetyltransferase n=1 Tax=Parasphingopyxis sp. TaxID=1920299 RepID=UPI0026021A44|nr:GNAT family N-acetyltransferase [Parasphingopyxis sp.]